MAEIHVISPSDRQVSSADATTGMVREQAVADSGIWVGRVRTAPGRPSGWHHHGDYETYLYVESGRIRMEYGPGGSTSSEAHPGDFVHVPGGVIHREVNPAEEEGAVILVRVGTGPSVVNVDGPLRPDTPHR